MLLILYSPEELTPEQMPQRPGTRLVDDSARARRHLNTDNQARRVIRHWLHFHHRQVWVYGIFPPILRRNLTECEVEGSGLSRSFVSLWEPHFITVDQGKRHPPRLVFERWIWTGQFSLTHHVRLRTHLD